MGLTLNFFWHMHQPDYRDAGGRMRMPWVFLHAIKDYYDMPWMLLGHPSIKATFNLTPSLIEQLRLYIDEGVESDRFLTLLIKHPSALTSQERAFVAKICHSAQMETMVAPLPRYAELFSRKELDDTAFIELETLFLLAWCGNYLRRHDDLVHTLLAKGRGYTQKDKEALVGRLVAFLPTILPLYAELLKQGRISLATTPYNHPILPLLIDMENARIANPQTSIPSNHFSLVEDAKAQIDRAVALYKEVFGCAPTGFWPAEGAVDAKSVALYRAAGLRWIATDEAILFKSLASDADHERLYRRYRYDDLFIAFRDHRLSDSIGFSYRYRPADAAADDFISQLAAIHAKAKESTVSVILDGENAWEFFPDNGYHFFEALYGALEGCSWCRTVTMDELAARKAENLPTLSPGSWIYGNFDTWVGHPEKNAAWELLYQTKSDYLMHENGVDAKIRSDVIHHFLAAECSDWFWWYGEDHFTEYAAEFDSLFRGHLIAVYEAIGLPPPPNLYEPIAGQKKDLHSLVNEPQFSIHPIIDGKISSFFEWLGSGMIDESRLYTTMEGRRGPVNRIRWGEDSDRLYLRLDGDMARVKQMRRLRIHVKERNETIDIDLGDLPIHGDIEAAMHNVLEIGISKRHYFAGLERATLRLELVEDGQIVQVLPGVGELVVDLKEEYEKNWFV